MLNISGYQLKEKLYQSPNSLIYRAYKQINGEIVILKMLSENYPSPKKIALFKREYEILKNLREISGVPYVYNLENDQNRWAIVMEDFGGQSLQKLLPKQGFSLTEFFHLAIKMVDILAEVHQREIIHKDINPSNFIFAPSTGEIKLIDFGLSTFLRQENPTRQNPCNLEGTLFYISPEQTGRMNRLIDYRTDFYSLGVTFYHLLTGQLPFSSNDVMELIHAHIAKKPVPAHKLKTNIPPILSEIVIKLMAKNAEERYQSAFGLKADLEKCLGQWQKKNEIEYFPLCQWDFSSRFQIPQKLYGREKEIESLLLCFARISRGAKEMMVISGYSGIGKTSLVKEVYKPLTGKKGYFIWGKFEQFKKDIPYSSWIKAFRFLINQLLSEGNEQFKIWQEKLLAALGVNSGVIMEVIPELKLILGSQPSVPELGFLEAQNRFNLVFENFIKVFAQPEHPLVLFLDDLHWADEASLKLLEKLMIDSDISHFLIIIAYRDNQVHNAHPLMLTLEQIKQAQINVHQILLSPLNLSSINQLVADTLNLELKKTQSLVELINKKTNGNPFFINEFLKSLYDQGVLRFDFQHHAWQFDLGEIEKLNMTDNVLVMMSSKMRKLPVATQKILQQAACVGNQFNLETLAIISRLSPQKVVVNLWQAIHEGLIIPLSENYQLLEIDVSNFRQKVAFEYKFAHDRIQQSAYSLINQINKQMIHWQIGQLLWQNIPPEKQEEKIFELVYHLNLGRKFINQQQHYDLAQLNLIAGKKAKASTAYEAACQYLKVGIELLGKNSWSEQYQLTWELYVEAAEIAYLTTDFARMNSLVEVLLQRAKTLLDKVHIYEIKIQDYIAQNKMRSAIKLALEVLKQLGINFPENPKESDLSVSLKKTKSVLGSKTIEELTALPNMRDPLKLATINILNSISAPAYFGVPQLYPLIICEEIILSVQYGNASVSPGAYANYGIILCGIIGDIEAAYQFGQIALRLLSRVQAREVRAMTIFLVNVFLIHWKEHLRKSLKILDAYHSALDAGNLEYASYSAYTYCAILYLLGTALTEVERKMADNNLVIAKFKQKTSLHYHRIYYQAILNLLGQSENPCFLIGDFYNEQEMLAIHQEANDVSGMFHLYLNKLILCNFFQDYPEALKNAVEAEKFIAGMAGTSLVPLFHFYDSLAQLGLFFEVSNSEQQKFLAKVSTNQEKMKKWADSAPMNYLHKFYLVEAERARVLKNDREAREYYDRAIALACKNEYLNEEALANELAARFYLARGQKHLVRHYLQDAHYAYEFWGAQAKVKDLEVRYPKFLVSRLSRTQIESSLSSISLTDGTSKEILDFSSVMKASQTISEEIILERLLENVMKTVIENAGAQKGFLILEKENNWFIEAVGEVNSDQMSILQSIPLESLDGKDQTNLLSKSVINYVLHTKNNVVLSDATSEGNFTDDPHIIATQTKSVLCIPLLHKNKINGILYLENNLTKGAFTGDRIEVLKILSAQAAISIENSRLYQQLENYSFTLEQKVEERTKELSETLKILKATQAKLIIENDLLKNAEQVSDFEYQVGGSLPLGAPTYVVRSADRYLYKALTRGDYCYVLNARQMGKSSLMVRMMNYLNDEGYICAVIDMTRIGSDNVTIEQWYKGLIVELWQSFDLIGKINIKAWWNEQLEISPVQRLSRFIEEVILVELGTEEETNRKKLVIFFDEIDNVLSLDFPVNDFFALIRSCYNQRNINQDYQRLTFAFFGVATPSDLIIDYQKTPFNIGQSIQLHDFQLHEAQPLLYGLTDKVSNPQTLLKEVLAWTGGQPFLTQKVCLLIRNSSSGISPKAEAEWIENLVRVNIIDNWESQDEPEHLRNIRDRLIYSKKSAQLIQLYLQVLDRGEVQATDNPLEKELILSGLVVNHGGNLKVHNRIYQLIFDQNYLSSFN